MNAIYAVSPVMSAMSVSPPQRISPVERSAPVSSVRSVSSAATAALVGGTGNAGRTSRVAAPASDRRTFSLQNEGRNEPPARNTQSRVSKPFYMQNMQAMLDVRPRTEVDPDYIRRAMERLGNVKRNMPVVEAA